MSEPIKSKHGDISKAPTPQNTPSSLTNSYLKSQPPGVSTISEEGERGVQSQLANNPALLSMIKGKLGTLVGKNSGYVDTLSPEVKNRVHGLKYLQKQQMALEADFQKELLELEKKYFSKYEPLYSRRRRIVTGNEEPTPEEIEEGKELQNDEESEEEQANENKAAESDINTEGTQQKQKGIPEFWFTCLENLQVVADTITERDSDVLKYLTDVTMRYLETPGFELIFEFAENPYFTNKILTKKYHYQAELGYSGDFVYDHAEGHEIDWKDKENNVTITLERRKQRNKNTKQTRTIEKLTPVESFFNFFDPPKPPKDPQDDQPDPDLASNSEDEADDDLEARLELDYQLGEEIKDHLIPRAIDWFTGDAVGYDIPEEFEDDEYGSEEDDDEDDDDDDDNNEKPAPKEGPPECKQQ